MSRVLLVFLTGCSLSYEEIEDIEKICSKVNRDNWYSAQWDEGSPHDVCRENGFLIREGLLPCTFGGLPFMCRKEDDGTVVGTRFGGPISFEISPADMGRAAPHLVIHN